MNEFLTKVQRTSIVYNLHVDFSKGNIDGKISGLFNEHGLIGMLEAADMKSIDMVSPFLGAIIDRCCAEVVTAPVTGTFTLFIDMIDEIYERDRIPGWTDSCLDALSRTIRLFKAQGRKVFENFQPSSMGFPKWHSLDHVVEDISSTGSISYMEGDLYEMAHKTIKGDLRNTSRRKATCMEGTINRQSYRILNQRSSNDERDEIKNQDNRLNISRMEAVRTDGAYLISTGDHGTFLHIREEHRNMYNKRKENRIHTEVPGCISDISHCVGEDGMQVLIRLLEHQFAILKIPLLVAQNLKVQFPSSAYISGYAVRNASSINNISNELYLSLIHI